MPEDLRRDLDQAYLVIACLLSKLGGKASIPAEMLEQERGRLVQTYTSSGGITLTLEVVERGVSGREIPCPAWGREEPHPAHDWNRLDGPAICRGWSTGQLLPEATTHSAPSETAVTILRTRVEAARQDMAGSRYWQGGTFFTGIDNAVGGEAGQLAAMFSPDVADLVADLLEEIRRQQGMPPCDKPNGCCNGCERRDDFVIADALAELISGGPRG